MRCILSRSSLLLTVFSTSRAFNSGLSFVPHKAGSSLFSSYGIEGPRREKTEEPNPEEDIQSYIKAPEPLKGRSTLSGKVLVSGWVNSRERSDQKVFDLLNDEDSPFEWEKIIAFVDDEKFAKKRLFSRTARYTGLSDKLEFLQSEKERGLPTVEQLKGVGTWVANVGSDLEAIKSIGDLCGKSEINNVSILVENSGGLDAQASAEAIAALDVASEKCQFTVVAVGEIYDDARGLGNAPYTVNDFGTEAGVVSGKYSRDESLTLVTHGLALGSGANKALSFTEAEAEDDAFKLVKGLREAGFTRYQEIDHMISKGVPAYEAAIADYKQRKFERENPDPEEEARLAEERAIQDKLNWEKSEKEFDERKKNEIEETARAWAKRQYFRKSMGGNMGMTEEEYIESVWERAMFEGDLKYRMMHGGKTDERKELAEFLSKQDKKKATALKKAKELLEDQLGTVIDADKVPAGSDDDSDDDDDE